MTEKEYVYVAVEIDAYTGHKADFKVFKTEENAESYIRNRYAYVEKMEVI